MGLDLIVQAVVDFVRKRRRLREARRIRAEQARRIRCHGDPTPCWPVCDREGMWREV